MRRVAKDEGIDVNTLCQNIASGKVAILANNRHKNFTPKGVGKGLSVKVNANIGTSPERVDIKDELKKLKMACDAGADAVMDLSTGGNLDEIRKIIMAEARIPIGTVPIYQVAVETVKKKKPVTSMAPDDIFDVIEKHGVDGVDFVTVHCGVTQNSLARLKKQGRITDIVAAAALSRGMVIINKKENPLYEQFDRLVKIAKKYDMTLSLGDGLRPGCIADATDRGQIEELVILGELCATALENDVQVMIEGPDMSHQPDEAKWYFEKAVQRGAFYVLGPM
jgi:phosphomethylpyrimidine synthase